MGPILTFMLMPCAAAVLVGWIARHWALAAAAVSGGIGGFLLLAPLGTAASRVLLPFTSGAAVAGLVLVAMLVWRPSVSVWSRMTFALAASFLTHFFYLSYAMAGR